MAKKQQFGKNDLIDFIEDSIREHGSLNPQMTKELEAVIKAQVEMNDADDFIKALSTGNEDIRSLLEDVLAGKNVRVAPKVSINLQGDAGNTEEIIDRADKTFRDVLDEDVKNNKRMFHLNKSAMKEALGEVYTTSSDVIGSRISDVLGEEKTNVVDPIMDVGKGIYNVAGRMRDLTAYEDEFGEDTHELQKEQFSIAKEAKESLDNIYAAEGMNHMEEMANDEDIVEAIDDTNRTLDGIYRAATVNTEGVELAGEANRKLDDIYKVQSDGLALDKQVELREQRQGKENMSYLSKTILAGIAGGILGLTMGSWLGSVLYPLEVAFKGFTDMFGDASGGEVAHGAVKQVGKAGMNSARKARGELTFFQKMMTWFSQKLLWIRKMGFFKWMGKMFGLMKSVAMGGFNLLRLKEGLVNVGDIFDSGSGILKGLFNLFVDTADDVEDGMTWFTRFARWMKSLPVIGNWIIKAGEILDKIGFAIMNWYTGSSKTAKIVMKVIDAFKWIGKLFGGFLNLLRAIPLTPIAAFFTGLAEGFMVGLRVLGKAVFYLVAVFDFFSGYLRSTADSFMAKIADGVRSMIHGFMDIFIYVGSWLYDKFLNMFGIESKGTGKKLVKMFDDVMVKYFGGFIEMFGPIVKGLWDAFTGFFGFFGNIIKWLWNVVTLDFEEAGEAFDNIWKNLGKFFVGLLKALFTSPYSGWIGEQWDKLGEVLSFANIWADIKTLTEGTIFDPIVQFFEDMGAWLDKMIAKVKKKLEDTWLIGGFFKDEDTKKAEKTAELQEKMSGLKSQRANIQAKIDKRDADPQRNFLQWAFSDRVGTDDAAEELDEEIVELNNQLKELNKDDTTIQKVRKGVTLVVPEGVKVAGAGAKSVASGGKSQLKHLMGGSKVKTSEDASLMSSHKKSIEPVSQANTNAMSAAAGAQMKMVRSSEDIKISVDKMNKATTEKADRPITINTGGGKEVTTFEPPTDIESMSILFLNKNWGLG